MYNGQDVCVSFDASLCIHAAACVRGLPEVFNTQRKPWILPDAADPQDVAMVVRRCPTGALEYGPGQERTVVAPEVPDTPTTVALIPDQPLTVRGDLTIITPDGTSVHQDRATFCRCGKTKNAPYCDLSHLEP
ncbi:MAG: (4Fe-4S)-binding protein [Propionibacteriaceae bacterium]|jgi:uncharacterized Fe-S cluster protein YjdI|nr:(4Fe-4S)-binding protein [Propionibacteriaceae bacterium]